MYLMIPVKAAKWSVLALAGVLVASAFSETVAVRLIVVNSLDEAERILTELKGGADFALLAREKSTDATSIDGGFLGSVDPESLRPELRDVLKGLRPGELSPVVRLPSGYALLKVLPQSEVSKLDDVNRGRQEAISAQSGVKIGPSVGAGGGPQAAMPLMPKPDAWEQDLQAICEVHLRSYAIAINRVNSLLDSGSEHNLARTGAKPYDFVSAGYEKGQLFAFVGDMPKAVAEWEATYRYALAKFPEALPFLDEVLGIGYLHMSEMENDIYHNPGDQCIFPVRRGMKYAQTASSEKAAQHLLKFLEQSPNDLEARWLLNVVEMTLGNYPDAVPPQYLMAPSLFSSSEAVGRFTDVAPEAGLNLFAMSSGVVVDDFDNDGLLDVITSSLDACAPMHLFHNNGDGTFSDRSAAAGLASQLGGLNLVAADYNNDGCLDVLVLRGAWESQPQRRSLLRNNCDGTFTDVTVASGLAKPASNSQAAVWADINNDGLLDLFVVNERGPSQLFLNKGDGTFQDISHSAGIDRTAFSKGVTAADYDADGYVDFYVTNLKGVNYLYRNNRNGTFTEVAEQAGVPGTGYSFATWFFDYDNDGWPDLFVALANASIDENVKTYLNRSHNLGTLKLYKNLGNGTFRDVTKETGLDKVFMPMGANFGDIDNDGYLDIYLGTGSPSYSSLVPNVMLRNKEGRSFVDVTASSGTGELHKGHGVAFADLDNDGDEDILTSIGGSTPGDAHTFRLFENPGNENDWITLRLVGVKTNHGAIGAKIKLTLTNEGKGTRAIYRTVGSQSSFGGSPLRQHIGLGKSATIQKIEIWWPGTSTPQTVSNIDKRQFVEIKEGAPGYTKVAYQPLTLGGAKRHTQ
jgi:FG-GAP-like repeat/ASPIC and UnbV/PPIC-type PPIASE domain